MKFLNVIGLAMLLSAIFLVQPVLAEDPPATDPACNKISDADRKNLCLATSNPTHGKKDVNRFTNKDHSWYYCSLVRSRDLQNLCLAVVDSKKEKCDLIGKKEIEEECRSKF